MVDRAILAKEAADQRGQGSIAIFDDDMLQTYVNRAEILSSFHSSLEKGEIQVFYQPLVQTSDGRICAAEALVRWKHPGKGWISPADFIPILENNGLISELDHYVLEQVYAFEESFFSAGKKCIPISINLSRQDFYNEQLMSDIFRFAKESSLPGGQINYEVTETSMAVMKEDCDYYLSQFRAAGARILLDDFGTGYSSLNMIGNHPLDVVKIDKSFIDRVEREPAARSVVEMSVRMFHNLGLAVVAEGIENERQLEFLRSLHCDFIQGFYYYRPMNASDFRELLNVSQESFPETNQPVLHEPDRADRFNLMDLIDHCGQFIQVCHPDDYTMVYANQMTRDISGHPDEPYEGKKCYQYMLGLNAPCGHCPMKKMEGQEEKEIETDDGEHAFRTIARYTTWNGKRVFIEYGRDVTGLQKTQDRYTSYIRSILEEIPEGQGVFHMDLTADKWLSSGGNAENARQMQNLKNVDELIRLIGSFVPTEEGRERFYTTFSREAQLKIYSENQHQITLETESYYDDRSIRWSRITAHLIDNPTNGHVESILYGVDISGETKHVEELEMERLHAKQEQEKLKKQVEEAMELYNKADHDRRYDYLTGLYSRLSLSDFMEDVKKGAQPPVHAVLMVDIDNFKSFNDKFGHSVGDQCLRAAGKALLTFGLANDISFYRYGGDEFIGMIRDETTDCDMKALTNSLMEEMQAIRIPAGDPANTELSVTVSIGWARGDADCTELINQADSAMYLAKKNGKNQVACAEEMAEVHKNT